MVGAREFGCKVDMQRKTIARTNVCFDVGWYDFMVRMYGVVCWCDE